MRTAFLQENLLVARRMGELNASLPVADLEAGVELS
jgi:hypothetical protein